MKEKCKYCQPESDYQGYDIESIKIITLNKKGNDKNNANGHLDNYGCCPNKKIIIKYSWFGKMIKEFHIPVKFCPYCGREL